MTQRAGITLWSGLFAVSCGVFAPAPATAQTALIVTAEAPAPTPPPDTGPLLSAMSAHGFDPIPDVSRRIIDRHSSPPVRPPADHLAKLREELEAVTRHLALGELHQAIERMRAIESMQADALDFLSREAAQARKLFDACVMTGYLLHQNGRIEEGKEQLRMCAASFPGFQLHKEVFTASVRQLYSEVISLSDQPVWLTVDGIGAGPECEVRLNGVNVGRAPITMRARPSSVRVQLECGDRPGRIHELSLSEGKHQVTVDPLLDAGLDTGSTIPYLHYATAPARARVVRHLAELGAAVGAKRVLRLHGRRGVWTLALVDVAQSEMTSPVAVEPSSPGPALDKLAPDPGAPRLAVELPADTTYAEGQPPEASIVGTGRVHDAYWIGLSALWLAGPIVSGAMIAHRREIRSRSGTIIDEDPPASASAKLADLNDSYNRDALVGFLGAGVPSLAWAFSAPFMPAQDGIPWYAWAAGGLGAALVGAGAVMLATTDTCHMTQRDGPCGHWVSDPIFAPLLLTHAIAPLSVPLTYAIANAFSVSPERASASIQASPDLATITIRGTF